MADEKEVKDREKESESLHKFSTYSIESYESKCPSKWLPDLIKLDRAILLEEEHSERLDWHIIEYANYKVNGISFSKHYDGDNEGTGTSKVEIGDFYHVSEGHDTETRIDVGEAYKFYETFNFSHLSIYALLDILFECADFSSAWRFYDVVTGGKALFLEEARNKKVEDLLALKETSKTGVSDCFQQWMPHGIKVQVRLLNKPDSNYYDAFDPKKTFYEQSSIISFEYDVSTFTQRNHLINKQTMYRDKNDGNVYIRRGGGTRGVVELNTEIEHMFFNALFSPLLPNITPLLPSSSESVYDIECRSDTAEVEKGNFSFADSKGAGFDKKAAENNETNTINNNNNKKPRH